MINEYAALTGLVALCAMAVGAIIYIGYINPYDDEEDDQ